MKKLLKNLRQNHADKVRFAIVGFANTALDFLILNLLVFAFGMNDILANAIAVAAAMIFSFVLNKKYTFKSNGKNYLREVILFFVCTSITAFGLQSLIIFLLTQIHTNLPEFIWLNFIKCVAVGAGMIVNFLTYKYIVFKKPAG
ncbi:MAG: GtrA family protein [Candidatus Nomurabacteria bacterium]|nr:GtrA family protein [Candidatus Nomurabacteria bacterium]